jgi:hypothetical protein
MIDYRTEQLRTLNQARRLPWMRGRFGNAVSLCTLMRWTSVGVRGRVLETVKIGGTVFTSEQATLRFIDSLNSRSTPRPAAVQNSRAIADADRRLDDVGV